MDSRLLSKYGKEILIEDFSIFMSFYQLYHPTRIYFVHDILDLAIFLFILNQSIIFFLARQNY